MLKNKFRHSSRINLFSVLLLISPFRAIRCRSFSQSNYISFCCIDEFSPCKTISQKDTLRPDLSKILIQQKINTNHNFRMSSFSTSSSSSSNTNNCNGKNGKDKKSEDLNRDDLSLNHRIPSTVECIEKEILVDEGMTLGVKIWKRKQPGKNNLKKTNNSGEGKVTKILMIHGWLDNASTFDRIAPEIVAHNIFPGDKLSLESPSGFDEFGPLRGPSYEIYAVDILGHGKSSHHSKDASYTVMDYIFYIMSLVRQLPLRTSISYDDFIQEQNKSNALQTKNLQKFHIIGHSLGGTLASAIAGAYPDFVQSTIWIESLGLISRPAEKAPKFLRAGIESRFTMNAVRNRGPRPYANLSAATDARLRTVDKLPGNQFLDRDSAKILVTRGSNKYINTGNTKKQEDNKHISSTIHVFDEDEDEDLNSDNLDEMKVTFCHDQRLLGSSLSYLTEEQAQAFLEAIECPVLAFQGNSGWPTPHFDDSASQRINILSRNLGNKFKIIKLDGSHHLHLDQEHYESVVSEILRFLDLNNKLANSDETSKL